jgi:LmbE family N-acetylglucosaminyl deacetylase
MKQHWPLHKESRVLIIAPHPDDESLACGGLLQEVAATGGESKVIFLTDGENNPWPQRVIECRWRIKEADRKRWGMRRRLEAITALAELGIPESSAVFWNFPDQGLTDLLLNADDEIPERLIREFREWQPTILITSARGDLHPDHSASAVFAQLALDRWSPSGDCPLHIEYLIHSRGQRHTYPCLTLALSEEQQKRKRYAILRHASQLKLRRNLTKFVMPTEKFLSPAEIRDLRDHPVRKVTIIGEEMELEITLSPCPGAFGRSTLYIASHMEGCPKERLSMTLSERGSALINIWDVIHGKVVAKAYFSGDRLRSKLRIPLTVLSPADFVCAKIDRRFGFFDEAGWCELPILTSINLRPTLIATPVITKSEVISREIAP